MMRIEHVAVWTRDLERLRAFYERWFGARAGAPYESANRPGFTSYFLAFPDGGARLELMRLPELDDAPAAPAAGYGHLAVSVGSEAAVRALAERMREAGVPLLSGPRWTGDGYFEAVVRDPDGNEVEITA
jgi:lactoylglutathione lyase